MSSAVVRPAQESDAGDILDIHVSSIKDLCSKSYSPEQIQVWSNRQCEENYKRFIKEQDKYGAFYVVEMEGRIVGFGHVKLPSAANEAVGDVMALYVSPRESGKGLGKLLLNALEISVRQAGVKCLYLRVCSTLNAAGFYEKCGFVAMKETLHSVGDGTDLKCTIMCKKLE